MTELSKHAALILIDVQKGFDAPNWGKRNNPDAEDRMKELLLCWRQTGRPIIHVRHMSTEPRSLLRPGQEGNEFKDGFQPSAKEHVEEKCVNSAFIGTNLEQYLKQSKVDALVLIGLTTDHCVSTTARMAGNLGFKTIVAGDATATFDRTTFDGQHLPAQDIHTSALASLHQEFATVMLTKDIIELAREHCQRQ